MRMTINLYGFDFEGPYPNIEEIEDKAGIYVVLCRNNFDVLDVGTAGEGMWPNSQGMKRRLKGHNRKSCWEKHCKNGQLSYAVMYIRAKEQRL